MEQSVLCAFVRSAVGGESKVQLLRGREITGETKVKYFKQGGSGQRSREDVVKKKKQLMNATCSCGSLADCS